MAMRGLTSEEAKAPAAARSAIADNVLSVVLDTNVYRLLPDGVSDAMTAAGRRAGHVSYVSLYTAMELLSHLADPADRDYSSARAALRRLWRHNESPAWGPALIALLHDTEAQLCFALFGAERERVELLPQAYHRLLRRAGTAAPGDSLAEIRSELAAVLGDRRRLEGDFAGDLVRPLAAVLPDAVQNGRVQLTPAQRAEVRQFIDSGSGRRLRAAGWVRGAAAALGRELTETVLNERVDAVFASLSAPLALYDELVRRVCVDGLTLDDPDHSGWMWDVYQSFAASREILLGDRPILLVTDDRAIRAAATAAGNAGCIASVSEYLASLNVGEVTPSGIFER
jgi:hypothetical protein